MVEWSGQPGFPLFDILSLERAPRVGPLTMARLVDAFGSPRAVLEAGAAEISRRTKLSEKLARAIADFVPPEDDIARDMEVLHRLGVRVVTRWDADYPLNLKEIYDPPAVLFVRGSFAADDIRAVAIVGTRRPTRYGIEVSTRLSRELVRANVTVISGLARGIDTAAHRAALKEGGRTIGVLGCGIDVAYPRENARLVEEMAETGAVITEFRPGAEPLGTNFYRRNRVVSGLAKGVVVVECKRQSGSLITAGHALEQNREVFAVPGSILTPASQGPHYLLKQGAALMESAEDILSALFTAPLPVQQSLLEPEERALPDLAESAQQVLEALDPDPVPIDVLCDAVRMEVGRLSGILLELELDGLVRQYPGKMFARIVR